MRYLTLFSLLIFALGFVACDNDQDLAVRTLVVTESPDYMAQSTTPFPAANNLGGMDIGILPPQSEEINDIIHLGRVLFYDRSMSANDKVSCATCHQQQFAFADPFQHSVGIGSQLSTRNTPSIVNVRFSQGLFWDQSSENMLTLSLEPVKNHREMGFSNMDALVSKLGHQAYYAELFEKAYGDDEITPNRIAQAITEFCGQLNSFDSDVDQGNLSMLAQHGQSLFAAKGCNDCHNVLNTSFGGIELNNATVIDNFGTFEGSFGYTGGTEVGSVANIGLNTVYDDNGVGALSGNAAENGKFRIPSLRNVAVTGPYMHDGRFKTLDEVLDFYSSGIRPHNNLDERLRNSDGSVKAISMTVSEKAAIKAFLQSLTSKDLLVNDLYSDPFAG